MAVYENRLTRADDFIIFTTRLPFTGVVRVDDFIDVVVGEDQFTYFQREISYSLDGLFFTPWLPLTTATLAAIVCPKGNLWVNYRYTRKGANSAVALEFDNVELIGEFAAQPCQNAYVLPKSIFKDFFCNNPQHLSMAAHLTKKLFEEGIVPNYINRNAGDDPAVDDADYLAFWGAVSAFFALIIMFGQQFEDIQNHPELFKEYLLQRGLLFGSKANATQLNYLRRNQYAVVRKRGTFGAIEASLSGSTIVSELVSLLDNDSSRDEYLISLLDHTLTGFTVGRSSPMYRGTTNNLGLNKAYEQTADVINLSKYPLVNPEFISTGIVSLLSGSQYTALLIKNVNVGKISGIGVGDSFIEPINVDAYTDYEISFYVQRIESNNSKLIFGVRALDALGKVLDLHTADVRELTSNNFTVDLKLPNQGGTYLVRGIMYGAMTNSQNRIANLTVDPTAQNLLMPKGMCKFTPVIAVDNMSSTNLTGNTCIWNLQIRPLKTGYSLGFVQSGPLVQAWLKNRNIGLSTFALETNIRETLLPYDTNLRVTYLHDVYRPDYIGKFQATFKVNNCTNDSNNDGSVILTILGGVEPYNYDWTYGQKSENIFDLTPDVYDVVIVDSQNPPQKLELTNMEVLPYARLKGWRPLVGAEYCISI